MLHEILLSLSGHPSPLFDAAATPQHVTPAIGRLLSPPETELLSSIGHLSRLHRRIRDHAAKIAASHPSTVCRAVAASISSHHLHAFQQAILQLESRILNQDTATVGAYNIVPLAGIASEFSEWPRIMEWLWTMSIFMAPPADAASQKTDQDASSLSSSSSSSSSSPCSGAQLIDRLRAEAQTGYPDIGQAARQLGQVAEASWLRQLSSWLLYGRLPSFGVSDFFIHQDDDDLDEASFCIHYALLPKFVTRHTASSILFIGKSLNQIQALSASQKAFNTSSNVSKLELLPAHMGLMSKVNPPVSTVALSEAVANIRLSLSRNLLQHLLPREKIVETLSILYQFFLIGRGEFAMALIAEADNRLSARLQGSSSTKAGHFIEGFMLKQAEVTQILTQSLSTLLTLTGEDDHTDDILDIASQSLHLNIHDSQAHRPGTPGRAKDADSVIPQMTDLSFNELLLSVPASLTMDIQPPLDLFITKADLKVYSIMNGYLLSFRRAHLRLAQLWRNSSIRREHPCPPGYQYSNSVQGKAMLNKRRERSMKRMRAMRKVWATCRATIFFLAESEAYFQGTVVQESFKHFLCWVTGSSNVQLVESSYATPQMVPSSTSQTSAMSNGSPHQHDPETLALAHRQLMLSITYYLLLTDMTFTKAFRGFCTHVDELVAYITRITKIQQNLDLEEDEGVEDFSQNYQKEEKEVSLELDRARRRLDGDLKSLVERLREIDSERIGASIPSFVNGMTMVEGMYEPLRAGGIDRLLMKLDWSGEDTKEDHQDLL